jgi:hypothetical protein
VAEPSAIQISQRVSQQSGGKRATAEKALTEGVQLYQQGTAQSLRKALAKYEEALKLFPEVDDRAQEALAPRKLSRPGSSHAL